ncbi:P-type conjugative transfer ATPase TrbB [Nitrosomonas sp. Is35]|uniref:P-type conjugative transfer ATPase TrbB n=1 Tax=unclassified Nitrosomonas TaxID=2609265 RepID=UPI00294AF4C8|nr:MULTISPECIES: P-type conjugative transfer ATPase TrbB [unclassified Nitrosomonas]MDV6342479.1 P-type conjugative transfer ATPase TrbB [Nitrosomonas sp. Is24]MDV6348383.1 P-type conjugative transfer ATPase TrbB [Nitrosomonas sp. Is35]
MTSQDQLPYIASVKDRAKSKLERDAREILSALQDPETVEIMVNADGRIWQEKLGQKIQHIGNIQAAQVEAVIKTVAGFHGKEINRFNPMIEGEFPLDNSRFAGQLPPIVSSPTFAIRKKAIKIFTLEQYVETGVLSPRHCDVIKEAVRKHRNILVIGGTGSGKTTLINAIINEMVVNDPDERIFILEDTGEIQCTARNFVQYHTTIDVDMTQLLKTTLRMRPDRILVGEVRGPEALDLLDAWNTGHEGGAATLHANDALSGLTRLESLISRNPSAPKEIMPLIAEAVDMVVHITRTPHGRKIQQIIEVQGFKRGSYQIKKL